MAGIAEKDDEVDCFLWATAGGWCMEPNFRIDREKFLWHPRWLETEMAPGIRVERLMMPRSRPINGMKRRQDGLDICEYPNSNSG
jgi:hypothetical protein